jgi:hypothetical protein
VTSSLAERRAPLSWKNKEDFPEEKNYHLNGIVGKETELVSKE